MNKYKWFDLVNRSLEKIYTQFIYELKKEDNEELYLFAVIIYLSFLFQF